MVKIYCLQKIFETTFDMYKAVPLSMLHVAHIRDQKLAGEVSLLSNISEEPRTDHSDPATTSGGQAEQFHPAFLSTDL